MAGDGTGGALRPFPTQDSLAPSSLIPAARTIFRGVNE